MKFILTFLAVTSAFVTAEDCVNKSSFCFIYKLLCSYSWHREWLQENCKGTCRNLCSPEPSCGTPQVDFNKDNSVAAKGSSPWQAVITLKGRPLCSGSLISSKWVLSAAHCVDGLQGFSSQFKVKFGENGLGIREGSEVEMEVEQIITHPLYNARTTTNDISLIKLKEPIKTNPSIIPVCLPQFGSLIHSGSRCYVTGSGEVKGTSDNKPRFQHTKVLIQPKKMCGDSNATVNKITDRMICIKDTGINTCNGDGGGPFVCQDGPGRAWRLNGVRSWGSQRCNGDSESYIVFTKVAAFRQWIDQTIEN